MTDTYLKAVGCVLIAIIVLLLLAKQGRDIWAVLSIAVCSMVAVVSFCIMEPVVHFFDQLLQIVDIDNEIVKILLKAVGVALISEIASLICTDSGNAGLGKSLQIGAACTVLWLAIPLFERFMELIRSALGAI